MKVFTFIYLIISFSAIAYTDGVSKDMSYKDWLGDYVLVSSSRTYDFSVVASDDINYDGAMTNSYIVTFKIDNTKSCNLLAIYDKHKNLVFLHEDIVSWNSDNSFEPFTIFDSYKYPIVLSSD